MISLTRHTRGWMLFLGMGLLISAPCRAGDFLDLINGIMRQKETANALIDAYRKKGTSGDVDRLASTAWPTLSLSAFAREYYLNQPQIDLSQYAVLTTQQVLGVGFTVNQDLVGFLTRGYSSIREPMERYQRLQLLTERMDRTNKYLSTFLVYVQHLRRLSRLEKASELLTTARKYMDPQLSGTDKIMTKIFVDSMIQQMETAEKTEALTVQKYEPFLLNSHLANEVAWAQVNAASLDIVGLSREVAELEGNHEYKERLRQQTSAAIKEQLDARQNLDWMDNFSISLNLSADVYGDDLENAESYGLLSINYALNDPNKEALELQRQSLAAQKLAADNEDLDVGNGDVEQEGIAQMSKDEFLNTVDEWSQMDKNFDGLFQLAKAGVFKSSETTESISMWLSAADQLESTLWAKIGEIMLAHQYSSLTGNEK